MAGRRARWGTGVGVVLAAVSGVLLSQLGGGWPWWFASAVVVAASAGLAMWLVPADQEPEKRPPGKVGAGAVYAGGNVKVRHGIKTSVRIDAEPAAGRPDATTGRTVEPGAIASDGDVDAGEVETDVEIGRPRG